MDLGAKPITPGTIGGEQAAQDTPKINYPSFTIDNEKAEEFLKAFDFDMGDALTATVTLEVSGLRKDNYGKTVTLQVKSIDNVEGGEASKTEGEEDEPVEEAPEGETPETDEEEKILGYKRPQIKKEAPPFGAKELQD